MIRRAIAPEKTGHEIGLPDFVPGFFVFTLKPTRIKMPLHSRPVGFSFSQFATITELTRWALSHVDEFELLVEKAKADFERLKQEVAEYSDLINSVTRDFPSLFGVGALSNGVSTMRTPGLCSAAEILDPAEYEELVATAAVGKIDFHKLLAKVIEYGPAILQMLLALAAKKAAVGNEPLTVSGRFVPKAEAKIKADEAKSSNVEHLGQGNGLPAQSE